MCIIRKCKHWKTVNVIQSFSRLYMKKKKVPPSTPISEDAKKKACKLKVYRTLFAEREGFEPPVPLGTAVFKTAVIDHSTISPISFAKECVCTPVRHVFLSVCKGTVFFVVCKIFLQFFHKIFNFGVLFFVRRA